MRRIVVAQSRLFGPSSPRLAQRRRARQPGNAEASMPTTTAPLQAHAAPPGAFAARLVGAGKRFGGVWAVRGIDLPIAAGEIHALMGENGAGKSTLMKMLHGVHRPDEGAVEIAGRAAALASPREAEAAGVAMVAQELDLFPDLSLVENLYVGRARPRSRWGGFDHAAMTREASAALARLGVELDLHAPARTLSGAQAQLLEIARALMHRAQILVLDEPTAALTDREAQRLMAIVRELAASGVAVLYVSHRLEEVFALADRITVLRDGRLVHTGPAGDLTPASLVQLMVGRPVETLFHRTRQAAGEVALEVKGLGRRGAFEDISFTVRRGEIVGLAGLIGAGRSEVAQAIFGIAPADAGDIRVMGAPASIANPRDAMARALIYVPEERRAQGLMLEEGVAWNTAFSALERVGRFGFVSRTKERALAERFRERFAIKCASLEAPVISLSGGNQQKVMLAKALATEPDVILLDEPTRGVDVGAKAEIHRIVDELVAAGKAVLMISSEMNDLLVMCDRILVMHQGRITAAFEGPGFSAEAIGAAAAGLAAEAVESPRLHPGGPQ